MRKLALLISAATLANIVAVLFLFGALSTGSNYISKRGGAHTDARYFLSSAPDASLSKTQVRKRITLP